MDNPVLLRRWRQPPRQRYAGTGLASTAIMMGLLFGAASAVASTWAVDPSLPGPSTSVGASLFDEITADGVPFPYEALLRKVEQATGCAPRRCATSVLIPLGRSLQRTAAAPEYFRYPRVVTAVIDGGATQLQIKDRLFLGYQERADLIEVISYNEAAGRFEFQLVRDYRADGERRVVPANRAVCVSCHQNHAPIFSRQQWDETNANPQIAGAIATRQTRGRTSLYGVAIRGEVDLPNAIDDAADRANLIGVVQRIWRDACDRRCRPAAVAAALQYRLSQEQGFAARTDVATAFSKAWPDGLAVPDPDLPNRDPLVIAVDSTPARQVDVPAVFEALKPRAPRDVWKTGDALLEARFVSGLAAMIADGDVDAFESDLSKVAAPRRALHSDCSVARELVTCDGEFAMTATRNFVERLVVDSGELTELSIIRGAVSRRGKPARTLAGQRIERLELKPTARGARATLILVEDFQAQRAAIERADWADVFTRNSLRVALGLKPMRQCCATPSVTLAEDQAVEPSGVATAFSAACGSCHQSAERSPPNFLAGDSVRVDAALRHCAQRMYVRLAMWQLPPVARAKVPMPPPRAALNGSPHEQLKADPAIGPLQATVADWLRSETGKVPAVDALLANGYENLRACLPTAVTGDAR